MLSIVSKDIAHSSLKKLEKYGEVMLFETQGITYNAIQNHPDIFLFQCYKSKVISAPNTPESFLNKLTSWGCCIIKGDKQVGSTYPETAAYNAVLSSDYLIHNLSITDDIIKQNCQNKMLLNIHQGYSRCNLVALPNNTFLTSDKGISKALKNERLPVLYVNPENILLRGFSHGFFGGCCGLNEEYFLFNGSLNYFTEKAEIEHFVKEAQLELVELSSEKPVDIGSILFLE